MPVSPLVLLLAEQSWLLSVDVIPDGSETGIVFVGFDLPTEPNVIDFSDDKFTTMSEDRIEILGESF